MLTGTGGTAGGQGQKGEPGTGADGSDGDKGQKGDTGATGGAGSSVPSGGIILWSGASNAIPSGWYLCNGSNGTPDLTNRFIVGAGSGYSVGNIGGSANATLVSHSHSVSGTTGNDTHSHSYIDQYVVINNGYRPWPASNNDCAQRNINTGGDTHSHSFSANTNTQGSSATNANLPPYYALCYIMKS